MKNNIITQNILVCFIVVTFLLFMTIGYASFNEELNVASNVTLIDEDIEDKVILDTKNNYVSSYNEDELVITLYISDEGNPNSSLKIKNTSSSTLTYTGNKALYEGDYYPMITGILPGDYLLPQEEKLVVIKSIDNSSLKDMEIEFSFAYNAIDTIKPVIVTNTIDPNVMINDGEGSLDIDIMNLYDSSIEVEFYLNDSDVGITLDNNHIFLNKGENKKVSLKVLGNIVDENIPTTLYAKVLNKGTDEDIYVIENIMFYKGA